jgi:hypothetical protein
VLGGEGEDGVGDGAAGGGIGLLAAAGGGGGVGGGGVGVGGVERGAEGGQVDVGAEDDVDGVLVVGAGRALL